MSGAAATEQALALSGARGRIGREWRTIEAMISITCRDLHGGRRGCLCQDCESLRQYAHLRLVRCPFGAAKPTCARCKVHCYKPEMRERVRQVMRHAGPKMLLHHPLLAMLHLLVDERRETPEKPAKRQAVPEGPSLVMHCQPDNHS